MAFTILHPHVWIAEEGFGEQGGYYAPPAHALGSIDLTPLPVWQATPVGTAYGCRFCEVDELPADPGDYLLLGGGDPRESRVTARILDGWERWTGYRPQGDTIEALLADHLLNGADPRGIDRCHPLIPGADRRTKIWCANRPLRDQPFVFTPCVIDHLKVTLAAAREDAIAGKLGLLTIDEEYHRRIATALCEKYRCDFSLIRPASWPAKETLLPHSTVINDTFNRTDSTGLGTASDGFTYSALTGRFDIASNQAQAATSTNRARADSDLSTADIYAQVGNSVVSGATNVGLMLRYSSAANAGFEFLCRNSATNTYRIFNWNGTSEALIDTAVSATAFAGGSIYCQASGSGLQLTALGVLRKSVTDSSYPSERRAGLYASGGSGSTFDDFQAGDLAGANHLLARLLTEGLFAGAHP